MGNAHRVYVPSLLNGEDNDYVEDSADAELAKVVLEDLRSDKKYDLDSVDEDIQNSTVPPYQQEEILTRAIQVCESQENINLNLIQGLRSLRHSVARNAIQSMQQSTIERVSNVEKNTPSL